MADPSKDASVPDEIAAFFSAGGEGGMSRGRSGGPMPVQPYAHLRRRTPSPPTRTTLPAAAKIPENWAAAPLAEDAMAEMQLEWTAPAATDRIIATRDAATGGEIFLERIKGPAAGDSGWYIGRVAVTESPAEAILVSDLLTARPDLERLLSLPPGHLVVIEPTGIVAVLNERDENIWKPKAKES
jgi:hypothetical protein